MSLFRAFLVGLMFALASGCAGYRLGPTNGVAAGSKTVHIAPFSNRTLQPRLGDAVTTALRRNVQNDGTFRLANDASADILVTGTLIDYDRRELSLLREDVLTASDFRVNVRARVTGKDRTSGTTLFDREVTGYTLVRVGSDLTSSERQALPVLADDLARNIAALLVDGTW